MFQVYSNLREALVAFGTSIAGIVNAFVGIVGLIFGILTIYCLYRLAKHLLRNVSVEITYKNSTARGR